jgi:small-conductance mechanosensitive channel/CRP-like cAMP-binding protein
MFADPTVHAATLFAGFALVLTLISFAFGSARRRGLIPMLAMVGVGLVVLLLRERVLDWFASPTVAVVIREVALAVIALAVIKIVVLFVFQTVLARRGIPKILDEFVIALTIVGYGIYRLDAVGVNLAGIITISSVITGALAFSAQSTLGNLWGGIALQLEKTCRIGDWVRIDNLTGQVVSIRWRYMAIATNANETIVIPNSTVMNNRITVIGRRGEEPAPWIRFLPFDVEYGPTPGRVITSLEKALAEAEIPNVSRDLPPRIGCTAYRDSGIEYQVEYRLIDPSKYWRTDSWIYSHVFAALRREGFRVPYPHRIIEMRGDLRGEAAQSDFRARVGALSKSDLFGALTDEERALLAPELKPCPFTDRDIVFHAGDAADSLYILADGTVRVVGEDKEKGKRFDLARLTAPTYFGEMGLLLGQPRGATVVADGEALCYRLDKDGFDDILHARPELAEMLGRVLAQRQAENDATFKALDAESRARQSVSRATDFMRRIQHFFGLQPAKPQPVPRDAGAPPPQRRDAG